MTISIAAKCHRTGQFGVAACTAMPAVGKLLTHARTGTGAVATQARLNPYLGIDGIRLLQEGLSADEVLEKLASDDPRAETRQFAVVDRDGAATAWTGADCLYWAGDRTGDCYTVQGNRLAGPQVVDAAAEVMENTRDEDLPDRLLAALDAAIDAGGDTKGHLSATIYIVDTEEYPLWDLRIDYSSNPLKDLEKMYKKICKELIPEIKKMPTRANPAGDLDERVAM